MSFMTAELVQHENKASSFSGTRKMVLRRMVPKGKNQNVIKLGVETASCLRETHQERWWVRPPPQPLLMGFPRGQEAVSTPKTINVWLLYFGTIQRSTILRVPDVHVYEKNSNAAAIRRTTGLLRPG